MAALFKFSRYLKRIGYLSKHSNINVNISPFCTVIEQPKPRSLLKISVIGASVGVAIGIGYSLHKIKEVRKNLSLDGTQMEIKSLKHKPPFAPSRKVIYPVDKSELKLTLFQYQTCPFCCKVRVFLDYYGISYDVVEVDPVLRREISWSSYKKVPIILANVNNEYQPLYDSSMIVSLLTSYLTDKSYDIQDLVNYYPSIAMHDDNGKFKNEILNKYFLMFGKAVPTEKSINDIVEERKWRQWADDVLVHTLSPNVYRTLDEAYETFNWFSDVGQWKSYFPSWERLIMINVGACAMWLISKRLKKRHNLKNDVRQSLYDEINYWLKEINARGTPFMGGQNPNLSDLAVYGILKSIEGCTAFKDLLNHTDLGIWYNDMKKRVDKNFGNTLLSS